MSHPPETSKETLPHQSWSPTDQQSPYYVWHLITEEEWLVIAQRYPFSVRVLVELSDETRWSEHARSQTVQQAQALMHGLARLHKRKPWWVGWVVTESSCLGNSVREKPVLWHPSKDHLLDRLSLAGLLPASGEPAQRSRP